MIVCIGDLVDDVVVHATDAFRPAADTPAHIRHRRGGSAANVAAAIARAGGAARFVGQVGDDGVAERLVERLTRTGVDVVVRRAGRTGTLIVVVSSDGERSFFTDRGAAVDLAGAEASWLEGATAVHLPAYGWVDGAIAVTTAEVVELARARGIPVSVDTSSTTVIGALGTTAVRDRLASTQADTVFANRDEAALLGLGPRRPAPGATWTVVRDGGRCTHLVAADGSTTTIAVPPVERVVDTTGAGDAFAAGWLLGRLRGAEPTVCIEHAHALAAGALTHPGADPDDAPLDQHHPHHQEPIQ